MDKIKPIHFSQVWGIKVLETELDFFDVNLRYDSLLFVDPFLIRNSIFEEEQGLYNRIGKFFKVAFDKAVKVRTDIESSEELLRFLSFREPKETGLGYTRLSNEGSGPGGSFAEALHTFFLGETARKLLRSRENEIEDINPEFYSVFANKVAEDGISDLTTNLIMDYLIAYTQKQCEAWGVKTKILPVGESFDFGELEWTGGGYHKLPENPYKKGEPVILVPKRFLRSSQNVTANIKSKLKGVLGGDPAIRERFGKILSKPIRDISIEEIEEILLADDSALNKLIDIINNQQKIPYDFNRDLLQFLAYKRLLDLKLFRKRPPGPKDCEDLLSHVECLVEEFKNQYERKDLWRDAPTKERAWGRIFRALGDIYFPIYPDITFMPEGESGRGTVDFIAIFMGCKITIELKFLKNTALAGDTKEYSYLHGITSQLPNYTINFKAQYAFYITGQHFRDPKQKSKNHDYRANEIRAEIPKSTRLIKMRVKDFKELRYVNIDMTPKLSFSKAKLRSTS